MIDGKKVETVFKEIITLFQTYNVNGLEGAALSGMVARSAVLKADDVKVTQQKPIIQVP